MVFFVSFEMNFLDSQKRTLSADIIMRKHEKRVKINN